MNRSYTFFFSAAILAIATSPVFAGHWDHTPDLQQSILNDHDDGFIGTSFAPAGLERGQGDAYGSVLLDVQAGDVRPSAGIEKGHGDDYGSVLNDL